MLIFLKLGNKKCKNLKNWFFLLKISSIFRLNFCACLSDKIFFLNISLVEIFCDIELFFRCWASDCYIRQVKLFCNINVGWFYKKLHEMAYARVFVTSNVMIQCKTDIRTQQMFNTFSRPLCTTCGIFSVTNSYLCHYRKNYPDIAHF